ncbi:MAG: anhydro-N-acetylmuramic acid kinase [Cytophagaceae bacterium]|nr:anhydro-N-acetylmuramic acid kinase [Cytophagaceae bacterium]
MKKYKVIGIMSGTSLDGLDIALCEFEKKKSQWAFKIKSAATLEYTLERKKTFNDLMKSSGEELMHADFEFGKFIGKEVNQFIKKNKVKADFISSHGHTIFHQPQRGFTCQIGSGSAIHATTGLPVVSDLRSVDVALGGQGAPLVPIGDKLLFSEYEFCLNLGGISNISFDYKGKRIAFDISPVNIVLNALAQKTGKEYDKDGALARSGKISEGLLSSLNKLDYYGKKFPKSIGKEWVDENVFPLLDLFDLSVQDKLCTFCEHIAIQIQEVIKKSGVKKKSARLLVTGGGAFNQFLIERINHHSKNKVKVIVPDKNTVMFKEALIFAFLGVLRIRNENSALKSVTGSSRDNIGGALYGKLPG